jgi:hypothetical protein
VRPRRLWQRSRRTAWTRANRTKVNRTKSNRTTYLPIYAFFCFVMEDSYLIRRELADYSTYWICCLEQIRRALNFILVKYINMCYFCQCFFYPSMILIDLIFIHFLFLLFCSFRRHDY